MKSLIAATAVAAVLSATTAYAAHPLLPNGWPVPESQTPYLTPEQIEHREFTNVQQEKFPGNRPATQNSRSRANTGIVRGAMPHPAYPSYYDDARHRP